MAATTAIKTIARILGTPTAAITRDAMDVTVKDGLDDAEDEPNGGRAA